MKHNNKQNQPPQNGDALINEKIRAERVQLIDEKGENIGVIARNQALRMAQDAELDLVMLSESGKDNVPVVKIMDFGKVLYERKKKQTEAKKNQKVIQVKEIKFRPGTEEGDYQVKLRNLVRFLSDGDRAKVSLRFRGREMAHQELGMELLKRVEGDLLEYGSVEQHPKMEGRQLIMVIAPKKKK